MSNERRAHFSELDRTAYVKKKKKEKSRLPDHEIGETYASFIETFVNA